MAYANLDCGDRVSWSATGDEYSQPQIGYAVQLLPRAPNEYYNETVGDAVSIEFNVQQQPVVPVTNLQYVLNPSPSFCPIFDDLLEGGSRSGESSEQGVNNDETTRKIEYLNRLLRDEERLSDFPFEFYHVQDLVYREIERVRRELRTGDYYPPVEEYLPSTSNEPTIFRRGKFDLDPFNEMPPPEGPIVTVVEKVFCPVDRHPNFNFFGRLCGPRGRTMKQIEQESGCQITIRGRGSENSKFEERKRGQRGYEHLSEPMHVRISANDHEDRAIFRVYRTKRLIERLLVPVDDDELKRNQLRDLARIRQVRNHRTSNSWTTAGSLSSIDEAAEAYHPAIIGDYHYQQNLPPEQSATVSAPMPTVVDPCGNTYYVDQAGEYQTFVPVVWSHDNAF